MARLRMLPTKAVRRGMFQKEFLKKCYIVWIWLNFNQFFFCFHSQNHISKEELEAQRHAEGVDAFLTFATEVSSMSSPIKRPPSADSHSYMMENIPHNYIIESTVYSPSSTTSPSSYHLHHHQQLQHHPFQMQQQQQQQQQLLHHSINQNHHHHSYSSSNNSAASYLSSPSPPKKARSRTLRTKLKKKSSWLR